MDDAAIARVVHVLAVVLWIGGIGVATTVLLAEIRRLKAPSERVAYFDRLERRFSWQTRITTGLRDCPGGTC